MRTEILALGVLSLEIAKIHLKNGNPSADL